MAIEQVEKDVLARPMTSSGSLLAEMVMATDIRYRYIYDGRILSLISIFEITRYLPLDLNIRSSDNCRIIHLA